MEDFIKSDEKIEGDFLFLLGGLTTSRIINTGVKINKTGIAVGIDLASKCGLENNYFISFGQIKDNYVLLFSKNPKKGFVKASNVNAKNYLTASLNGINKINSEKYLGAYTATKNCPLGSDSSVSCIILRRNDDK